MQKNVRRLPKFSGKTNKQTKTFSELKVKQQSKADIQILPEIQAIILTLLSNATLISGKIPKQRFKFHDIVNFA